MTLGCSPRHTGLGVPVPRRRLAYWAPPRGIWRRLPGGRPRAR